MKTWGGGWGGGESRKSSNVIRGEHFNEVTFKGGDRLNFTLFSPKSFPPAINNDRSLNNLAEQENIFYGDDK